MVKSQDEATLNKVYFTSLYDREFSVVVRSFIAKMVRLLDICFCLCGSELSFADKYQYRTYVQLFILRKMKPMVVSLE